MSFSDLQNTLKISQKVLVGGIRAKLVEYLSVEQFSQEPFVSQFSERIVASKEACQYKITETFLLEILCA